MAFGIDRHRLEWLLHPLLAAWVTSGSLSPTACAHKHDEKTFTELYESLLFLLSEDSTHLTEHIRLEGFF